MAFKLKLKWKIWVPAILLLLIGTEIYLRKYWGFCDSVLMMENKHYEYIAQPNQDRFRFRHHVQYNSFSMRSPEPDTSAWVILGFGDSVINGGVMVDQDSLATTLLSAQLSNSLHRKVQVLNISAGSWGPDNNYAYLQEKGNFNAKMILLVASSHDAYDNMDFIPVIDKMHRFESKQYHFAIWELIHKYILPRMSDSFSHEDPVGKKSNTFNTGFASLDKYCKDRGIPFIIYLNPDKYELEGKGYHKEGREIIRFCEENNIPLIQGLNNTLPGDYRGAIHMNDSGQRHMAKAILPVILETLNQGAGL